MKLTYRGSSNESNIKVIKPASNCSILCYLPMSITKTVKLRRLTAAMFLSLLSNTAVLLVPTSPSQATQSDCDGNAVIGRFRRVGSGASFSFNGRKVELQNESALDTYSRAEIKSGWRSGDRVWVDRSYKRYMPFDSGIKSDADAKSQGWKQCGPFSGRRTQSVINSVYAARACALIDGVTKCGKWYLD
jgi:hypothetical protein